MLSGGVFQNRRAARADRARCCERAGLRVLVPERLPPNDGGISYGQAAVAARAWRLRGERRCSGLTTGSPSSRRARRSLVVLAVALLLGLRHASDPDHLAAVSTLIASDPDDGTRRAGRLGLAWGPGHALDARPVRPADRAAPAPTCRTRSSARPRPLVGVMIMLLAAAAAACAGGAATSTRTRTATATLEHRHLHPHDARTRHDHAHEPEARLGRSPAQAFGIGLVHGMGGSAGVGVLLLATIPGQAEAVAALVVLALGTAVSMAAAVVGVRLRDHPRARAPGGCSPSRPRWASLTLAFGGWYALGAIGAVPYLL